MTLEISLAGGGRIPRQPNGEGHLNQREQPLQRHRGMKENGVSGGVLVAGGLSGWAGCAQGPSPAGEVGKAVTLGTNCQGPCIRFLLQSEPYT